MSEELKTIQTINPSPFKHLCVTIGELPSSFIESMTYYECLAWLVDYLQKTVIPAVNANGEATAELQEKFVELKTFVDNYFDNLDVQEEINNKLDEMVEDGTLQTLIAPYTSQLRFIRVSDTYNENDYIDLESLIASAIQQKKALYIDGTYRINQNATINDYVEIFGGKLIVDSFQADSYTRNVIDAQAPCYIHDIEFESTADKTPSINIHAGLNYGYASNVKCVVIHSSNVIIERIKGESVWGIAIYGDADSVLNNIIIDKCNFNHCEIGVYCENAEIKCTNCTFFMSTDVQSIYYHPFYIARARNSIIENIEIGNNALVYPNVNLTSYVLNDIFHLYNADDEYTYLTENVSINNIEVRGRGFHRFAHCRFVKNITFSNINAELKDTIIQLGGSYSNVLFNNCNFVIENENNNSKLVYLNTSVDATSTDNIKISSSNISFINDANYIFEYCNLTLDNCHVYSPTSDLTYPISNTKTGYLKFINCYTKLNRLRRLYVGLGKLYFINCYFDNTAVNNYLNDDVEDVLDIRVINCYFAMLKHMFHTEIINTNTFYNVYGYNPDRTNYRHIYNYEDVDVPESS